MRLINDLIDFIFPRRCLVCGDTLSPGEEDLCLNCLMQMPRIAAAQRAELEKVFYGLVEVERATSYMYYRKGNPYNRLIHALKYKDRPKTGERLAFAAATELEKEKFFEGIDLIIPLPLSKKKERSRGYNQCYHIAKGLSQATGIPFNCECVMRNKSNETQTHKNREERWENVKNLFAVTNPDALTEKHILLIDDVLTTGATLTSCAQTIKSSCNCKISLFTLAYSSNEI